MKKMLIIALVCVNVGLLLALVFGTANIPQAKAQPGRGGGTDYLMVTGEISSDYEAVYIIDLAQRRLRGVKFDRSRKRLVPMQGRELEGDFSNRSGKK